MGSWGGGGMIHFMHLPWGASQKVIQLWSTLPGAGAWENPDIDVCCQLSSWTAAGGGSLLLVTYSPPASELFSFWIVLFPPTLPQAILQAEQQLLRRFWFVWHQQAAVCQLERQQQAMAIAHHHSGLLRRAFCIWKESTQGFRIE